MAVQKVQMTQPNNSNKYAKVALASGVGAVAGAASRYVIPTKKELSSMFNKEAVDSFVSTSAANARGNGRSMLKYGGIGAVAAAGLALLSKVFPKKSENELPDYSKMGALIDAPDYAVEIMWYGE